MEKVGSMGGEEPGVGQGGRGRGPGSPGGRNRESGGEGGGRKAEAARLGDTNMKLGAGMSKPFGQRFSEAWPVRLSLPPAGARSPQRWGWAKPLHPVPLPLVGREGLGSPSRLTPLPPSPGTRPTQAGVLAADGREGQALGSPPLPTACTCDSL